MTTVEVDVDIDDILWEMYDTEKEDLCQKLIEDGYGPKNIDSKDLDEVLDAETYTESELVHLLNAIWSNRIHVDHKLVDELTRQLKTRNVL